MLKLLAIFSLWGVYLFLLGTTVVGLTSRLARVKFDPFLSLPVGLIVNLLLSLVLAKYSLVNLVGGVLAIFGAVVLWKQRMTSLGALGGRLTFWVAPFWLVVLVVFQMIFTEPLCDWDARSYWFFQAKVIFHGGGLRLTPDWVNPEYSVGKMLTNPEHFAPGMMGQVPGGHWGYPKLVPSLAAQIMTPLGFWNEFLPKISIALVFAAFLSLLCGITKEWTNRAYFLGFALAASGVLLWNGYVDAYLGLFSGLACLAWAGYARQGDQNQFLRFAVCVGLLTSLKTEGLFVLLSLFSMITVSLWLKTKEATRSKGVRIGVREVILLCVFLAPFVVWGFLKSHWGIKNWSDLSPSLVEVARDRIWAGKSFAMIAWWLVWKSEFWRLLLLLLSLVWLGGVIGKSAERDYIPPIVAAFVYVTLLTAAFIVSPLNLHFHLETSAGRLMLTPGFMLLASICLRAEGLWEGLREPRGREAVQTPSPA